MNPATRACELVGRLTGVDLSPYKDQVLLRRLRARAREAGLSDTSEYLALLEAGGPAARDEARRLAGGVNVGVSGFFRDPAVFEQLEREVYPLLAASVAAGDPIRIWCAGCSSGQEAYSLAISVSRFLRKAGTLRTASVLGTDVEEGAIARAREAVYGARLLKGVPPEVLGECFESLPGGEHRVREDIRRMIRWERADLLRFEGHPSGFQLVTCRNLLIYLRREVQEELLVALQSALLPGGFLVLGQGETVLGRPWRLFEHLSPSHRIYRKPL